MRVRILEAWERGNRNQGRNTYLWRDLDWTLASATGAGPLISVKDCFDAAGSPTSLGTTFYRQRNGIAQQDSWAVERLLAAGAVLMGKTHLHPLAYGLTGENPDFGDCLQPNDSALLTGGSSSGAAASVQEGSADAALATDTGGSIRVPAALCGLAGYRASLGRGDWRGAAHLAESFDTMGFLFRHLADAPRFGALLGPVSDGAPYQRFAVPDEKFLQDCDPVIRAALVAGERALTALGLRGEVIPVGWWEPSRDIFAAIQASEAARHHQGHFPAFEAAIRQRLEWGASLTPGEMSERRARLADFRQRMDVLLARHELLLMPSAPVLRLAAGADHGPVRPRILRYTTPVSLAGLPAVSLPGGLQLAAAREDDGRLLHLAARLENL
ncbi:MAG: hypothetical protein K2X03_16525 [Bryobacteraceae bacterium]|nr:hypothetical protein [Bryobacteraceae bacterium]